MISITLTDQEISEMNVVFDTAVKSQGLLVLGTVTNMINKINEAVYASKAKEVDTKNAIDKTLEDAGVPTVGEKAIKPIEVKPVHKKPASLRNKK